MLAGDVVLVGEGTEFVGDSCGNMLVVDAVPVGEGWLLGGLRLKDGCPFVFSDYVSR